MVMVRGKRIARWTWSRRLLRDSIRSRRYELRWRGKREDLGEPQELGVEHGLWWRRQCGRGERRAIAAWGNDRSGFRLSALLSLVAFLTQGDALGWDNVAPLALELNKAVVPYYRKMTYPKSVPFIVGSHGDYEWLVTEDNLDYFLLDDFLQSCPEIVLASTSQSHQLIAVAFSLMMKKPWTVGNAMETSLTVRGFQTLRAYLAMAGTSGTYLRSLFD